ncbi:MAG: hypothetical protein A2Y15_03795 [Clostridiales bacterium GWF2_36_10]|nr:MAG: hypothetical protein A2Y15_03795 [Clostridiales bacterium GWF2_36_10]HAN22094.1 hypothetical protein [Clostridiales bacterium]
MNVSEAYEFWNTWKGRYLTPDRVEFLKANPCNDGGKLVNDQGWYIQPENIFGEANLLENGAFTVCWPLLSPTYKSFFSQDQLMCILGLRARWCALFKDSVDYRNSISKLLHNNDQKNVVLNTQLEKWNEYLSSHGFTQFEKNDLRGVNLSGLDLSGNDFSGINLAHLDLSYSDFSVANLRGAYLYNSKIEYSNGLFCDISMAILDQTRFKHSLFSNSWFLCSSFSFSQIVESIFYNSRFDGANLYKTSVIGSSFQNATFEMYKSNETRNSKPCNIEEVVGDEKTIAPFTFINNGEV